MGKAFFVTGTDTEIGKTYVSGLLVKKLKEYGMNPAYFKAAMSGNDRREDGTLIPGDALHVKEASGIEQSLEAMCPYVYETAVSPHLASRLEGHPVQMDRVLKELDATLEAYDHVVMEGSGGILCPLCFDEAKFGVEDVIQARQLPCVVVADAGLGTINHVGLTIFYMQQKGIAVKGVLMNHYIPGNVMQEDNIKMCEHITGVPVVACVQDGDTDIALTKEQLEALFA